MRNIEIGLSDGFIGNKAILVALSALTTGNLNAKMKQGSTPFTMKDVLPSTHGYIAPPLSEQEKIEQVNQRLLEFMILAPGAEQGLKDVQRSDMADRRA